MREMHYSASGCPRCGCHSVRAIFVKKTPKWQCSHCGKEWKRRRFNTGDGLTTSQMGVMRELLDSKFTPRSYKQRLDEKGYLILEFISEDESLRVIRVGRKGGMTLMNCAEDRLVTGPDVLTAKTY